MNRWINFVVEVIRHFQPFRPNSLLSFARRFSKTPGWYPSMFLFALWGCHFIFMGQFQIVQGLNPFGIVTCIVWTEITCIFIWLALFDSVRKLKRLGLGSCHRDRVWFEASGLAWHIATFAAVVTIAVSLLEMILQAKPFAWGTGKSVIFILLSIWALTGGTGYVLALFRWRIPRGRSFECVNFFLPLVASILLIDRGQQALQPEAAVEIGLAILIISASFLMTATTLNKSEQWG